MKNKSLVIVSIIALVAIFFAGSYMYKSNESAKIEKLATTTSKSSDGPFVRDHSMTFGENKKNVVVVEFIDPECEACAYFYPAVKEVYKEYYEEIKLVIRYLANHRNSEFAVKILESSRAQNKYAEVLEVIFKTQPKWAQHGNTKPELLWELLKSVEGLDIEKLKKDVATIDVKNILSKDRMDAALLRVQGTPSFFVNGKRVEKLSYQALVDLVESEIYK